jgi:cation transporter-like permease
MLEDVAGFLVAAPPVLIVIGAVGLLVAARLRSTRS